MKNSYPPTFYSPKVIVQNVRKRNAFVKFRSCEVLRIKFGISFKNYLLKNVLLVFTSPVRVKSFFTFKDKLPKMLLSGFVYKCKCGGCNATYYCKTKLHFEVRISEHLGISNLTGKKVKIDNKKLTAIQEHLLCCSYSPTFEGFSILTREVMTLK